MQQILGRFIDLLPATLGLYGRENFQR